MSDGPFDQPEDALILGIITFFALVFVVLLWK